MTDSKVITKEQWKQKVTSMNATQYMLSPDRLFWNYQTKSYKKYCDARKAVDRDMAKVCNSHRMLLLYSSYDNYMWAKSEWEDELADAMRKAKGRMAIINAGNVLLERYMRRVRRPL